MGLYPVPPDQRDDRLKLAEQGQSPDDALLQEFIAALQERPQSTVQRPKPLSVNDRLYMALRGAQDPEFRKRVVDPLLAERAGYPAAAAAGEEEARQQRIKELGSAVAAVGQYRLRGAQTEAIPEATAAKMLSAQAAMQRARNAFARGGKLYTIPGVIIPEGWPGAGEPGIEVGIADPDTGERNVVGYRLKSIRGVVITDEQGTQTLQDPYIRPQGGESVRGGPAIPGAPTGGKPAPTNRLATGGISKQPGPGIQRDVAQRVSTLDGFADLKQAYRAVKTQGSDYGLMAREGVGEYFPRIQEKEDPALSIFVATRRAALNRYIKAVTGAQFSITELRRYEAQLPGAGANDAVADTKIRLLAQQALSEFRELVKMNGGLNTLARDPDLQKRLGILGLNVDRARAALDLGEPETEAGPTPLPPGVPPGSVPAGRHRKTGAAVWRAPDGSLWSE